MSSQVLSFRMSTEEVLLLRQHAQPGESDNQTAQRLMREMVGTYTSYTSYTLSTADLDERIESVVSEKFASFVASHNNLLERLQKRLQKVEGSLGKCRA